MKIEIPTEMGAQQAASMMVAERIEFTYSLGASNHVFDLPDLEKDEQDWSDFLEAFDDEAGEPLEYTVVP